MTPRRTPRTADEPRHHARLFWQKAGRFAAAARRDFAAGDWDPAVSAAIHAAINVADTICVHYLGERNAGEHGDVLALLRTVSELDAGLRERLGRHIEALLDMKNMAEYEARGADRDEASSALRHMDRTLAAADALADKSGWA